MGRLAFSSVPESAKRWLWISMIAIASILFGFALACATPFAALVTLAALKMTRRDALLLTGAVWLSNQIVGYGFLQYPTTFESYAWGAVIGISAVLALLAATLLTTRLPPSEWPYHRRNGWLAWRLRHL